MLYHLGMKATVNFGDATPRPPARAARAWSSQQQAIFAWFEQGRGNLVVRARAGTGKTTTILEGVERAPERQILLAAFNKSIAKELQARVRNPRVEAKTLHGLGFKYVRRNWTGVQVEDDDRRGERAGKLARRACGEQAPDPIVKVVANLHTKVREIAPHARDVADVESIAARFDLLPDGEWEQDGWGVREVCDAALRAMGFAKERVEAIDFADMIFLPLVHRWVRPWFDLVVVDEAQDMSEAQLELATLACRRSGRIAVVGDDRQAIYAFRGADSGSLDRLKSELHATELGLTTTYRCCQLVVDLARKLVPDYEAAPGAPAGEILRADSEQMLDQAVEGDFVLSRTNAPLVKICMALLRRNVRARVKGRDVGRGVVALIRKMRARTVAALPAKLAAYVEKEIARAQKLAEGPREARVEFVTDQQAIVLALMEGASTVAELETRCNELFSDDVERAAVMCSTVHRAKGLETERTFLLEGTFRGGYIEEDNIRYVAITRAKARLTWVTGYETRSKGVEA